MLGRQFKHSPNRIFISLPDYISKIYNKYAPMLTIRGHYHTPMTVNTRRFKAMCPVYEAEEGI